MSTCYGMYDPKKRNIIRIRDFKFNEDVFPLKQVVEEDWENPMLPVQNSEQGRSEALNSQE